MSEINSLHSVYCCKFLLSVRWRDQVGDGIVWFGKYSVGCIATGSWKREWTVLPLATVVALQTMWASANMSQDCGLLLLIEHLYVFFSD